MKVPKSMFTYSFNADRDYYNYPSGLRKKKGATNEGKSSVPMDSVRSIDDFEDGTIDVTSIIPTERPLLSIHSSGLIN